MKQLKWIVIGILLALMSFWLYISYFSPIAKDIRDLEKKVKVLRLVAEQRELQFKILQFESRMKPKGPEKKEQE